IIARARRWRAILGGAMRQTGVVASPCLVALDTTVDRLADDHRHARRLAEGLAAVDGITVDLDRVETNIVQAEAGPLGWDADDLRHHLWQAGIRVNTTSATAVRLVTYRGIESADIEEALARIEAMMGRAGRPAAAKHRVPR
ncbi:MAG: beta-eliminating lyase-related protein, partial [Thermaerobacterales bacterium]